MFYLNGIRPISFPQHPRFSAAPRDHARTPPRLCVIVATSSCCCRHRPRCEPLDGGARSSEKKKGLRCRNRSETAGCTRRVIRKAPSPAPVMTCAMSTGSAVRGAPARRIDCRSAEPSKSLRRATLADRRRCGQVPVTVRTKSTWSDPGTTDLALPNDVPPRSLLRTQTTWVRRCPLS